MRSPKPSKDTADTSETTKPATTANTFNLLVARRNTGMITMVAMSNPTKPPRELLASIPTINSRTIITARTRDRTKPFFILVVVMFPVCASEWINLPIDGLNRDSQYPHQPRVHAKERQRKPAALLLFTKGPNGSPAPSGAITRNCRSSGFASPANRTLSMSPKNENRPPDTEIRPKNRMIECQ